MTDRNLRIVTGIMAVALVVVVSWTLFIIGSRGEPSAAASPGPGSSLAVGSPSASTGAGASASASATASESPAASASTKPSASPKASPSPSPTPVPTAPNATLTFVELQLDSESNPAGQAQVITFTSDGPGTIRARLTTHSSLGTTHMCLQRGTTTPVCKDWAKGSITGSTRQNKVNWRVTLQGNAARTPVVSLTLIFPSLNPKVKISHAHFDGQSSPELNGIHVVAETRVAGDIRVLAAWNGDPANYQVDVNTNRFASDNPANAADHSFPVDPFTNYDVVLQNTDEGSGTRDLTATISWP